MVLAMRIALALVAIAGTAAAAPLSRVAEDLDGDGKPEDVTLDSDGKLAITSLGQTTAIAIAPAITRGTVTARRVRGVPTVVADATTAAGDETVVIQRV